MPLNVRRFYSSLLLILAGIFVTADAQTVPPTASPSASPTATTQTSTQTPPLAEPVQQVRTPSAAEIMRDRISKAKAFIAVRNYSAANYELESIRRESADQSVLSVVNVLLMNSYLEQGDYKRAQDFLNEAYNVQKTTKPGAAVNYFAIAGQVVKGARTRVERYRALGLNPSDRTLPLEAINDLEKMRETLELVVTQSKEISKDKVKSPDALAMLEEASTSRSMIARDDYDASKWQNELADVREDLASSRSVVLSAVTDAPATATMPSQPIAQNQPQQNSVITDTSYKQPASSVTGQNRVNDSSTSLVKSTVMSQPINAPQKNDPIPPYVPMQNNQQGHPSAPAQSVTQVPAQNNSVPQQPVQTSAQNAAKQPATQQPVVQSPANQTPNTSTAENSQKNSAVTASTVADTTKVSGPLSVGSLLPYVTKQQAPVYPAAAKSLRATGVVTIALTVDEQGNVEQIDNVSGPGMLQSAAKDAIRKWHFKPFVRDGQPVRATGFISFNFSL